MKLWKNNRVDQEWELADEEIIRRFKASEYAKADMGTDRALRLFLTGSEERGGLASVFVEKEFTPLVRRLVKVRRS